MMTDAQTPTHSCATLSGLLCERSKPLPPMQRPESRPLAAALLHQTPDGCKTPSILNARGHHAWPGHNPNPKGEET